jgi:hypothetical protein
MNLNRTMSFQLSKKLTDKEIENISAASANFTFPTVSVGYGQNGLDVHLDNNVA